jgi:hypothetical protein
LRSRELTHDVGYVLALVEYRRLILECAARQSINHMSSRASIVRADARYGFQFRREADWNHSSIVAGEVASA